MRTSYKILLLIFVSVFIAGMVQLFILRFEAGDIYPPYSSLRADPLGTKAFYESLAGLRGMDVSRNYEEEDKVRDARYAAFLYFGVKSHNFHNLPEKDVKMLEGIAAGGGRIVLCLYPQTGRPAGNKDKKPENKADDKKDPPPAQKPEKEDNAVKGIDLAKRWQFAFAVQPSAAPAYQAVPSHAYFEKPSQNVSWHSSSYFTIDGSAWVSVYEVTGHPVIIERKYGRGSLVLATDSYFASNEAMVRERRPELLAWLCGPHEKVIFDETHLGINENRGMAWLFRKHNLQGPLIAIVFLGILFIWKNAFSLAPAGPDEDNAKDNEVASGKDSISGFVGVLRRMIRPAALLPLCLEEWDKTIRQTRQRPAGTDKRETIRALVEAQTGTGRVIKDDKIVATYNAISKILTERQIP